MLQLPEVNQEIVRDKAKETAIKQHFNSLPISKQPQALKSLTCWESLYYFFKAEVPAFRQLGEVGWDGNWNCI